MTVQEFYQYCVEHGLTDKELCIQFRDDGGYYNGNEVANTDAFVVEGNKLIV